MRSWKFSAALTPLRCPGRSDRDRDTGRAHPTGTAAGNGIWGAGEGARQGWKVERGGGSASGQREARPCLCEGLGCTGACRPGVKGSRERNGAGRLSELPSCLHGG